VIYSCARAELQKNHTCACASIELRELGPEVDVISHAVLANSSQPM